MATRVECVSDFQDGPGSSHCQAVTCPCSNPARDTCPDHSCAAVPLLCCTDLTFLQGAKGALLAAPAPSSGYYPDWGWFKTRSGDPEFAEWPFFANLKCTAYSCPCWERLKGQSILPAAGLTLKQYTELRAAIKADGGIKGTIESQVCVRAGLAPWGWVAGAWEVGQRL